MATPILLVDDSKVCVEIVKSVETCDDQKALNMNPVLNENASLSSVNNALEADTNDDACESLVFEQFITSCTPYLKIPGDEPIITKLRRHYGKIDLECQRSSKFLSEIGRFSLQVNSNDIYIIIQELVTFLKSCHAMSASKKQAHIRKLENYLKKLDKKIQELQAQDIDLDDEDNSIYVLEGRYKAKFATVYAKLCDIVGYSTTDPKPKITFEGTRYSEINKSITKYLNKNDEFPDYKDILEIITETKLENTNQTVGLCMSEEQISTITRDVFETIVKKLKKRRLEEFEETFGSTLTDDIAIDENNDPAEHDTELKEKLANNERLASKRLEEVIESYVLKQEIHAREEDDNSSNEEDEDDEDGDDEEEDDDDDDEELEEEITLDEENLLYDVEDTNSSELPPKTEESENNHRDFYVDALTNSIQIPPPKIEPSERGEAKNGFLAELDVKPNAKLLTIKSKDLLSSETNANTNNESNFKNNRAVKREISCIGIEKIDLKPSVKRKALIQHDDDDVIVLSD